jgi:hypothetical protein
MEKGYRDELPELVMGKFITDGHPHVLASAVVSALSVHDLEEVDVASVMVDDWGFVAILDEEKNLIEVIVRPDNPEAEAAAEAFLKEYDPEHERRLQYSEYFFSYQEGGRYAAQNLK